MTKNLPQSATTTPTFTLLRRTTLQFLFTTAETLNVPDIVKHSALSLLTHRFLPNFQHISKTPFPIPTLQLFSLVSLWVSSKLHSSTPLSLLALTSFSNTHITDYHFTKRDFLEAELVFLKTVDFHLGVTSCVYAILEEMVEKLRGVSKVVGDEKVSLEACLDVLDLCYESEGAVFSRLFVDMPVCFAAGILVAVFVISAGRPKQQDEELEFGFPIVEWVGLVEKCSKEDVLCVVRLVLDHVCSGLDCVRE